MLHRVLRLAALHGIHSVARGELTDESSADEISAAARNIADALIARMPDLLR